MGNLNLFDVSGESMEQPIVAAETEQAALRALEQAFSTVAPGESRRVLQFSGGPADELDLPPSVCQALAQLVHYLAAGQGVELVPTDKELTTQQAADLLNVSRPYLVKLLETGAIPFTKIGTHRRLRINDVLAYKQQRNAGRRQALRRLTELSQEFGLYDE